MPVTSIGDLAQNFKQRSIGNRLHRELSTLNLELTTGLKQDVSKAVAGKTKPVAAIERALTLIDAQSLAVKEANIFADATGTALAATKSRIEGIELGGMAITNGMPKLQIDAMAQSARIAFTGMISDLGTQAAGRALFGGATGTSQTLRSAEDILADLAASLAGATSAADIEAGVNEYFGINIDPSEEYAFRTNDYLGEAVDLAPFDLGDGSTADIGIRADDTEIRTALAEVARVAVLSEDLGVSQQARAETLAEGSLGLLQARNEIIALEARLGTGAASIEDAMVRIGIERDGLQTARLGLLAADPYETATRLQQTEFQISSIYTLTARLSGLNLVSYLR
ncbi:flagellar hook-associated protein 3 FlgL [Palleronia marisminoris]|uniref:Flagellar hook-associated protein FlgL n=1 Tax=Palleronia marisminoris TaxID=315423 RepID=A0A1Y5T252_9RHOB|nr:flagellin [Palleronia marisminoris]SFH04754.1 flagellar hook-associated protein 3 FlgL [Palleronia marisminoris]SLN50438.1 flagellar hook-associated protein FlgL [Palleronia marisminoris]